jgi:hypothetical protein
MTACNRTVKRSVCGLMLAAAVSLALGVSAAVVGGATVSGKVVDEQGAVVANVRVAVMPMPNRDAAPAPKAAQDQPDNKPEKKPGDKPGKGPKKDPGAPGAGPGDRPRPQPIAETETDADGKFSMTGIPAGTYMVVAGGRGVGMGRQRVELAEGQTLEVELKLMPRPPRQPGGEPAPKN